MILGTLVEIEQRVTQLLKFMFDYYLLVFKVRKTSDFRPPFGHRVQNFVTPGHMAACVGNPNFSLRTQAADPADKHIQHPLPRRRLNFVTGSLKRDDLLLSQPKISFYNFIRCVFHPNAWWRNCSHTHY